MTCQEFADFIAEYLSGELAADTRTQFEQHIEVCPNCVAYLSNYRDTVALGRAAFADGEAAVPAEVPDTLVQAILASRRQRD